ncbi:hypothetical protein SNE40_007660 [Patella caerulea]|uniref:Proteasome assembly chaperone 4 n=1 Tax=Patella caerulea TaxID=87958 RepID=A0AAN8K407_PATCE
MAENIVPCPSTLSIHNFSEKIMDIQVNYQVLKMEDSFHIWIGNEAEMGNMSLAMMPSSEKSLATSVHLLGDSSNNLVCGIAEKLAKKSGKQVFVSSGLTYDQLLTPLVEKRIFEELRNQPDKF